MSSFQWPPSGGSPNAITSLTGDVTAAGPGAAAAALTATTNATLATLSNSTGVAVHGNNGAAEVSAGYIGEFLGSEFGTFTNVPGATTVFANPSGCHITLTPGCWELYAYAVFTLNGSVTTAVSLSIGFSTSDGGSLGISQARMAPPTATNDSTCVVAGVNLRESISITIYANIAATYSAGTPQAAVGIRAYRRG
jgi:hypothetical protein